MVSLIFQGIPEQIGLCLLAFLLANIPIDWKKIVGSGIVLAALAFIIRSLPLMFGTHTIALMITLFMILRFIGQAEISSSLIACLVSFALLIMFEAICLNFVVPSFNIDVYQAIENPWQRVLVTLPQVVMLYILAWIIYRLKKRGLVNEF